MEFPIFINGESCGRLEMQQDGLYTLFEAIVPQLSDEIIKLWLWSGEKGMYLGTMLPQGGVMYLRRKISRRELSVNSTDIEYASNRNKPERKEDEKKPEEKPVEISEISIETVEAEISEEGIAELTKDVKEVILECSAEECLARETKVGEVSKDEAYREEESKDDDMLWFSTPEGTLRGFDGENSIVALPAELHRAPPGAQLKRIDGRDYMVFRY